MTTENAVNSDGQKKTKKSWWTRFLVWAAFIPNPDEPIAKDLIPNLPPLVLANAVTRQFYKDRNYIRLRRRRWAIGAVIIRLMALALSSAATIFLGLADLSGLAAWGFTLSALVTTVSALETFFNFRSRWVSADEALARWHRSEEELQTYVNTTPVGRLLSSEIVKFDEERRDEWSRFSQDWLSDRRSATPGSSI